MNLQPLSGKWPTSRRRSPSATSLHQFKARSLLSRHRALVRTQVHPRRREMATLVLRWRHRHLQITRLLLWQRRSRRVPLAWLRPSFMQVHSAVWSTLSSNCEVWTLVSIPFGGCWKLAPLLQLHCHRRPPRYPALPRRRSNQPAYH